MGVLGYGHERNDAAYAAAVLGRRFTRTASQRAIHPEVVQRTGNQRKNIPLLATQIAAGGGRTVGTRGPDGPSQTLVPSGWAQVDAVEKTKKANDKALPIEIGKFRVMVDNNTDPNLLAKTCRVLVSLC